MNKVLNNIQILLTTCGCLTSDDTVLIVSDTQTHDIGKLFEDQALTLTTSVRQMTIPPSDTPGSGEPPDSVAEAMYASTLIIALTSSSMAHTHARHRATNHGSRYLSLPGYSMALLARDSIAADYHGLTPEVDVFAAMLSDANRVLIESEIGTKLSLSIQGRMGNSCPGVVRKKGELGSPPDIEANIAIVEEESNGIFVVDGSIPCRELGLVSEPVKLGIEAGKIITIEGKNANVLQDIFSRYPDKARVPAELGFGFNKKAELSGNMLEDEGCYGTLHIGFGSNKTIGGENDVPFHLDMVIRKPDVYLDDKKVIERGVFLWK